jgi:plasmid stabilization system protein ParE
VTGVRLSRLARGDLERITGHLVAHEVVDVESRIAEILDALQLLALHPLIGRPVSGEQRELVIGRGARGYVALYEYDEVRDEVVVAALRGQRESGFREGL